MEKISITNVILVFALAYGIGMLAYFIFKQSIKNSELQRKNEAAKLDEFRAHLERQIMDLNNNFSISNDRWNEINHLVLAGQKPDAGKKSAVFSDFLKLHNIEKDDIDSRQDLVFMLTPFHDDTIPEYNLIKSIGKDHNIEVTRGDERKDPGEIFSNILKLMVSSKIIIANITGRNPNVFYELGIAHALDKKVILISHHSAVVPFDLSSKRVIFYSDLKELEIKINEVFKENFPTMEEPLNS